jgi:hypothetical protein
MVVSEEGFEPPTPWFVATCSNPLSYRPRLHWIYYQVPFPFSKVTFFRPMEWLIRCGRLGVFFIKYKERYYISKCRVKGKGYRYRVLKKTTFEKE